MKYPMINKQPRREVNIPQLSGGLNLRDSLTGVRDNQMTDCVNMWYKDGMLRTRPRVGNANFWMSPGRDHIEKTKVFHEITNDDAVLVSYCAKTYAGGVYFRFYWQSKTNLTFIGDFKEYFYELDEEVKYFVIEKDGVLYCYTGKCNIFKCEFKTGSTEWTETNPSEFYIPTVMVHCQRTGIYDYNGVQFEGYNLLTPRFKIVYSAYNENDNNAEHPMRYNFGTQIATEGTITATITYVDTYGNPQEQTHSIDASVLADNRWSYENEPNANDGLCMYACRDYVGFSFESGSDTMPVAKLNTEEYKRKYGMIEDNLEIEATALQEGSEKEKTLAKVFSMTQSVWFGGSANGLNDGSRLFLCGNTEESEKSLVIWSGLNNPLYFSENNYAYVGNKAEPVTAFGKQGENLIIFKPNETYYSYYAQNSDINANDLINQTVVDYEANSVYFPMVTLHSTIGCDCPDTVQLCRNRLVWLNSNGKVYTLVSANQYSEMTIYPVSDMIERRIKATHSVEQLKAATSHDFEGHYVLMIECDAYVMDYNSYGYTHVYGYSKTEDANCLIPWYYWRFNIESKNVKFYGFKDFIFSFYKINDSDVLTFCVLCSSDINENFYEEKIVSSLQTKMLDFLAGHYLKNIDRMSVGFGNNGGEPISVSFVTDKGIESDVVSLNGAQTDERQAAFVKVKNFYPSARAVRTFGVKIECEGPLVIDGLALQYRLLGGVK